MSISMKEREKKTHCFSPVFYTGYDKKIFFQSICTQTQYCVSILCSYINSTKTSQCVIQKYILIRHSRGCTHLTKSISIFPLDKGDDSGVQTSMHDNTLNIDKNINMPLLLLVPMYTFDSG